MDSASDDTVSDPAPDRAPETDPASASATSGTTVPLTTGPADGLALVQALRGPAGGAEEQTGDGIEIWGTPLHASPAELAARLEALGLEDFLVHEARHSVGNYALVWRQDGRDGRITVVTAPGHGGAYVRQGARHLAVAAAMADALGLTPDPIEADPFGMSFYLSHAPASNFNMLPFTTMFRDLRRLPPGSVAVLEQARLLRCQSYLNRLDRLDPPDSFRAALEEVAEAIAAAARRDGRQVVLMFSGGAGSLALWLVLRDRLEPGALRLVCVNQAGSNGPARAVPVARALEAALEILDPEDPATGQGFDPAAAEAALVAQMARDIPAFPAPHAALLGRPDLLILNGQNFDVLTNGNMEVLPEFHEVGYLSEPAGRITSTEARVMRRDRAFIANLAFTDAYLGDEGFQKLSAPFLAAPLREANPDPNPGPEGALRGLISRRVPNVLSPARYPLKQVQHLNAELALFRDHLAGGEVSARMAFDLMNLLAHGQIAARRIAGLPPGPGAEMVLPAMSGPIASYFLGRPRGLAEANQPKREIYALARVLAGRAYRSLIKPDPDDPVPPAPPRPRLDATRPFAVAAETFLASPDPNPLIEGLREPAVRAHVFEALDKLREGLGVLRVSKTGGLNDFQKNLMIRVGNLLAILRTARALQASGQASGPKSGPESGPDFGPDAADPAPGDG